MVIEGYVRKDWNKFVKFIPMPYSYSRTQKRNKLSIPAIYDKDDVYLDKRTRFKKVKIRLTLYEV